MRVRMTVIYQNEFDGMTESDAVFDKQMRICTNF